jgi:branched-chain amino acid transport system substrate-binding protein
MQKRFSAAHIGAAVLGLTLSGAVHAAEPPLKIGVMMPYSGPSASTGRHLDNGFKVYMQQHGDSVAGRKIEIVRKDTTGPAPAVAKRIARELVVQDKVDFILGVDFTPNAIPIAPISTEAKTPTLITIASTQGIMKNAPYMVRFSQTQPQTTVPLGAWAARNGIRKVFILVQDYATGHDARDAFTRAFQAGGGSVVEAVAVPMDAVDVSSYIRRIKDVKPDAVYVFMTPGDQARNFFRTADAQGLAKAGIRMLADGVTLSDYNLDSYGNGALGAISAHHYSAAHDSPLNRAYVKAYTAIAGGGERPNFTTVAAYDALHAVYQVVKAQNGKLDPDRTMELLKRMKFESPRGPIEIDPQTREIIQNVYIRRVDNVNGQLANIEFETLPMVKDPVREAAK